METQHTPIYSGVVQTKPDYLLGYYTKGLDNSVSVELLDLQYNLVFKDGKLQGFIHQHQSVICLYNTDDEHDLFTDEYFDFAIGYEIRNLTGYKLDDYFHVSEFSKHSLGQLEEEMGIISR